MIIDCIADLHGFYPEMDVGDLLIVAGDLTKRDEEEEMFQFYSWLDDQEYTKKIFIGGNHDNQLQKKGSDFFLDREEEAEYLCDSGTQFQGLKIWGSPWTRTFKGMNPHCKAFTVDTEEELEEKWRLIPPDTDILITHEPPYGIKDLVYKDGKHCHVGSHTLLYYSRMHQPRLHVFGHIHEGWGIQRPNLGFVDLDGYPIYVNASHVNEYYEPVNKLIKVEL